MLEAIIFDMDGVLLDSESMHYDVLREMMNTYGYDYTPEHFLEYCGMSEKMVWPIFLKRAGLEDLDPDTMLERHQSLYQIRRRREGLPEFPGLKSFLENLKQAGYKIAVASASLPEVIVENLHLLGIEEYFDAVVSAVNCKHGKPQPDVFLLAAEQLGAEPADCLVVEDSMNGIRAAQNARMPYVGFAGARVRPNLTDVKFVFDDYRNIDTDMIRYWHKNQ